MKKTNKKEKHGKIKALFLFQNILITKIKFLNKKKKIKIILINQRKISLKKILN